MTYSEKLRDPRWQKLRLHILERDAFTCRICLGMEKELQVHHAYYAKKIEPWEADPNTLFSLCVDCHKNVEELKKEISVLMCKAFYGYESFLAVSKVIKNNAGGLITSILDSAAERPQSLINLSQFLMSIRYSNPDKTYEQEWKEYAKSLDNE